MAQASNNQTYSLTQFYVTTPDQGTKLLTENGAVTLNWSSGVQRVKTLVKGFAGISPGSAMVEFTIDNAVPALGLEWDPTQYAGDGIECEFTVFMASSTVSFKGYVETIDYSQSTDGEAKLSVKGVGGYSSIDAGF